MLSSCARHHVISLGSRTINVILLLSCLFIAYISYTVVDQVQYRSSDRVGEPYYKKPLLARREKPHRDRTPREYCSLKVFPFGRWVDEDRGGEAYRGAREWLWSDRAWFNMPASRQRSDGRCGNLHYSGGHSPLRALCDPDGVSPCCDPDTWTCRNMTVSECAECGGYDVRREVVAEAARWQHRHDRTGCRLLNLTAVSLCHEYSRLVGTGRGRGRRVEVMFVGDSLMRHTYQGARLLADGDGRIGAIRTKLNGHEKLTKQIKKLVLSNCTGYRQFSESSLCRLGAGSMFGADYCNGSLHLSFNKVYKSSQYQQRKSVLRAYFKQRARPFNYLFMGFGWHDNCNWTRIRDGMIIPIMKDYLRYIQLEVATNYSWPQIVWLPEHASGMYKPSKWSSTQSLTGCQLMEAELARFLRRWHTRGVVLDTRNITSGVASPDGSHYGVAINLLKAQLVYNYILEHMTNVRRSAGAARYQTHHR